MVIDAYDDSPKSASKMLPKPWRGGSLKSRQRMNVCSVTILTAGMNQ